MENYAQGGWVLTKQSSDPLATKLSGLKLGETDSEDIVILEKMLPTLISQTSDLHHPASSLHLTIGCNSSPPSTTLLLTS